MHTLEHRIAQKINAQPEQVTAAIRLLDEGATVPFIARYRKEVTNGLDDTQLRHLETHLSYLREFDARQLIILNSIREQGKLTDALEQAILATDSKTHLEDLYLPFKPKRRTKAQLAIEAGLAPLATLLLEQPDTHPEQAAIRYINSEAGFVDPKTVLEGARYILMDHFSEDAALVGQLRTLLWSEGMITAAVIEEKRDQAIKYSDYFAFSEAIRNIPSHRALALFRARNEGFLTLTLHLPEARQPLPEQMIAGCFGVVDRQRAADDWLMTTVRWAWKIKLFTRLDIDLKNQLRDAAEHEAIAVFSRNLKDLLLAAPAGNQAILGLDPGLRTGVKVACVDQTGKVLDTTTIYPHAPRHAWQDALGVLARLCQQHHIALISIGNGTASRETDKLAAELMSIHPHLKKIVVSEAGASVYSASELAAQEFPDLDVSLRGAVSIARRLQDPLAELVKIEPKAIGVGQYQHDVNQAELARCLNATVEDCVNAVGVDVNTASTALLTRISGLNQTIAHNIVSYRDQYGAFTHRLALKKVPRLGEKTFEQAAGFLRIRGDNPLDSSSVHPEAYPVVERIVQQHQQSITTIMGNVSFLRQLNPADYICARFGIPTVKDIIAELEKPGRDPRPEFKMAHFQEGVEKLSDLCVGMLLEGVVTNVANFGAFVDIGVHQDGLVHISAMSEQFIKDPRQVVKAGQIIKVKVVEVDLARQRVQLTMRLNDSPVSDTASAHRPSVNKSTPSTRSKSVAASKPSNGNSAFADAFAKAKR